MELLRDVRLKISRFGIKSRNGSVLQIEGTWAIDEVVFVPFFSKNGLLYSRVPS